MFWKAIVLAIAAVIGARWYAFKKKRNADGLPLRQDRDGTYRPDDWPERFERIAVKSYWWLVFGFIGLAWTVVGAIYFFDLSLIQR